MNISKCFFATFVGLFLCSLSCAHETSWKPSNDADYHEAIVKITGDGYGGSGTVIKKIGPADVDGYYIGWVLTASHVIKDNDTLFTIYFNNGAITEGGKVVVKSNYNYDSYCDYGVIRALIPNRVKPMEISEEDVPVGENVEMCGFGRGSFKHWLGVYAGDKEDGDGHIIFAHAVQGDSGGPIIYKGKVVGVICFGTAVENFDDTRRKVVAPVYGTCVSRVKLFDE